jgi:hypothetical protein
MPSIWSYAQRIRQFVHTRRSPTLPPSLASPHCCSRKKDSKLKSPEGSLHHGTSRRALSVVQDRRKDPSEKTSHRRRRLFCLRRPPESTPVSLWSIQIQTVHFMKIQWPLLILAMNRYRPMPNSHVAPPEFCLV